MESGGMTAPSSPIYELLPIFKAPRGGIEFKIDGYSKQSKNDRFLQIAMGVALTTDQHALVCLLFGSSDADNSD